MADAIVMRRTDTSRIQAVLDPLGIAMEPYRRSLGAETAHLCSRGNASLILAVDQPEHWKQTSDIRRDLVVVALERTGFLLRGDDKRLRDDIRDRLKEFEWRPDTDASTRDIQPR